MRERFHIVHVGQTGQHERTNPDYVDKHVAQLAKDFKACPESWRECFIAGLHAKDRKALIDRGVIK